MAELGLLVPLAPRSKPIKGNVWRCKMMLLGRFNQNTMFQPRHLTRILMTMSSTRECVDSPNEEEEDTVSVSKRMCCINYEDEAEYSPSSSNDDEEDDNDKLENYNGEGDDKGAGRGRWLSSRARTSRPITKGIANTNP